MSAVLYVVRRDARRRWRAWLLLAIVLGIASGAAIATAAGARRTATAFPRLARDTEMFHVLANPDDGDMDFNRIERLPGVEQHGRYRGVALLAMIHGKPEDSIAAMALDGHVGYEFDRPKLVTGRMPSLDASDEIVVQPSTFNRLHLHLGSKVPMVVFSEDDATNLDEGREPKGTPLKMRVVGVVLDPVSTIETDDDNVAFSYVGPGFLERYHPYVPYQGESMRLRGGARQIASFVQAAQRVDHEDQVYYQTRTQLENTAARAARPYWVALALFALVSAVTGLFIVGQAISRQLGLTASDGRSLRGLGMSRRSLFLAAQLRVGMIAATGIALGVIASIPASTWFPLGAVRASEPHPGVSVDWTVLLIGSAAMLTFVVLVTLPAAIRSSHAAAAQPDVASGRVTTSLQRIGLRPPAVAGVGMAIDSSARASANRATIVGAIASVAALVGAFVFGSSLDHLLHTPRLYGAAWDLTLRLDYDEHNAPALSGLDKKIAAIPGVRAASLASQGQLTIHRHPVPVVGVQTSGIGPTVASGRLPTHDGEIALGADTARRAGASIGDSVRVSSGASTEMLHVVGRVVFPRFAAYPGSDKTGLGVGAILTHQDLTRLVPSSYVSMVFVDTGGHRTPDVVHRLQQQTRTILGTNSEGEQRSEVLVPARPDELRGYEGVDRTPLALAGFLTVIAGATTAHALVSSVRRRRRDLALLKTLGFDRRQVRAAVAWQATTVAVLALAIGLPLGVIGGRWAWRTLATYVGALAEPRVPLAIVFGLVPLVLFLANAVAFVPGRRAARVPAAVVLRSE